MTGFPGAAPEVKIWDFAANIPLAADKRPKGSNRLIQAFKCWGNELSVTGRGTDTAGSTITGPTLIPISLGIPSEISYSFLRIYMVSLLRTLLRTATGRPPKLVSHPSVWNAGVD